MDFRSLDEVGALLRTAATEHILPLFRALRDDEIMAKNGDDVVTAADHAVEVYLTAKLGARFPGVRVLGEETVAARPESREEALADGNFWIIDPVDGTRNFVAGDPDFGVIVALVLDRVVTAAWIWLPVAQTMYDASLTVGTRRNGTPISAAPQRLPAQAHVHARPRTAPDNVLAALERAAFAAIDPGPASAAVTYARLMDRQADACFYWRSEPWDHVAGAFLVSRCGGRAGRPDGRPYDAYSGGDGVVVTAHAASWAAVRDAYLGDV